MHCKRIDQRPRDSSMRSGEHGREGQFWTVDAINRYGWTSSIGIVARHHSVRPPWADRSSSALPLLCRSASAHAGQSMLIHSLAKEGGESVTVRRSRLSQLHARR